jgi:Zn-dependent protease with chaperone function
LTASQHEPLGPQKAESTVGNRPPRLNPFAFPSDTNFRFALLIVAVLGSSLLIYSVIYNSIPVYWGRYQAAQDRCSEAARASHPTESFEDSLGRSSQFAQCIEPTERERAQWMIGCLLVLLAVAGAIYWVLPTWKIRRRGLVPLTSEDAPEVAAYLAELCREAGLARPPAFVWNPLDAAANGLAFGRLGRYYVYLGRGLVNQFYSSRPAFRAVVLHELAHLRNRDVDKTYFTVALWQAFVLAALLPLVVTLRHSAAEKILSFGWRVLGLTALVFLTRNAILRARELYADVRASVWDGRGGALGRVLEALPKPRRRWAVLRVHPDPGERVRALQDTQPLFRMSSWDALGTGVAAAIAFDNVRFLLPLPVPSSSPAFLSALGAALVFAPLAAGVVGLGVWRSAFAEVARGVAMPAAGRLGAGLGLGVILGRHLSFVEYGYSHSSAAITGWWLIGFEVLWGGLLLVGLILVMRWIAAGASAWLEVSISSRSPRPAYLAGLTIAGGFLTLWLGLLFYLDTFRAAGHALPLSSIHQYITGHIGVGVSQGLALIALLAAVGVLSSLSQPVTLVALISLWAFPLAAWLPRRRATASVTSTWALLDPSPRPLSVLLKEPLRPGVALKAGVIGGVVWCALSLIAYLLLSRQESGLALWALYGQAVLAALVQACVAAITVRRVKRLAWVHGLFAAFVSGIVMSGGALGLTRILMGTPPAGFAWAVSSEILNGGGLLALFASLWVSWFRSWRRPAPPDGDASPALANSK